MRYEDKKALPVVYGTYRRQCDYVIALERLVLDALIVADGLSNVYDNEQ